MDRQVAACLLLVLMAFVPFSSASSSWKLCDPEGSYRVTVQDVKVNPDPVIRGNDATFEIPAVASETITGGTVTIQVYYLGVPVHTEKDDLCSKTSCPVTAGEFSLLNTQGLPEFTPTGAYRLDMRIQNEDGDLLTCLKINFRINSDSSALHRTQ